jgi:hypothetical protein
MTWTVISEPWSTCRSGRDRPVIGQHPQLGVVEALADRADAEVDAVAVVKADDAGGGHLDQSCGVGAEQVAKVVGSRAVHPASGGRDRRAQSESAVPRSH